MTAPAKISIIIPVLNEEANVERVVLSSTAIADEVLVVDGGSSDDTLEILKTLQCEVIHGPRGRGQQLFAGAEKASGDVLLFLHADTLLPSEARDQILDDWNSLDEGERELFYGCFHQRIESVSPIFRLIEKGNYLRAKFQKLPYGDQGVFVSRTLYDRVGGMPKISLMEDLEFARKVSAFSNPKLLPGPISVDARRWESVGPIRQTLRNWTLASRYRMGVSPEKLTKQY